MRVPLLCLLAAALQAAVLRPAAVGAAPPPPLHVASPPSAADVQALLDEMHALQRQADALLGAVEEEVAAAEAAGPRRLQAAAGVMFEVRRLWEVGCVCCPPGVLGFFSPLIQVLLFLSPSVC